VNGLSLGFAVVANIALCLNMVGRLRFAWAQPITIIGFMLASIILIVLVSITSRSAFLPGPPAEFALTQAWYYACWAAGLYFIITVLMLITVYGALTEKFPRQFELNGSQRTLMLQTTAFMLYLIGGAAIYTQLEGWSYPDAVFWADFTLLTIGFGTPLVPKSHAGRSLLFPYLFGGLIAVGLVIGSIRSMLLEKGAIKMHARATEKRRQKVLSMKDADKASSPITSLFLRQRKNKPSPRADTHYKSERERRRQEFLAMRKIQADAETKQKWMALFFSSLAAASLWAIGALVFYKSEYAQAWTYFQSLYFAFASLTTLGYGDFQPYSNSGKAFFVLWSLLAIPTLTVLVSDLGGTIVSIIAELTALIGSLTVAPTDKEFWRRLRRNIDIVFGSRKHPTNNNAKLDKENLHIIKKKKGSHHDKTRLGRWHELLRSRLTESEQDAIDKYGREHGESSEQRNVFFYHFLLTKEIRAVLRDSQMDKDKTYTYDEWAYFLKLIGHDEEDAELHTKQYNKPKRDDEAGPQAGRIVDHDGKPKEWSWLSLRSPLLSQMTEPEWICDRLLKKLQSEMRFDRRTGRDNDDDDRPALDMARFVTQRAGRTESGSGGSDEVTEQGEDEDEDEQPSQHTAWKRHEQRKAQEEEEEEEEEEGEEEEEEEVLDSDDKKAKDIDDRKRERQGEVDQAVDESSKRPQDQKSPS